MVQGVHAGKDLRNLSLGIDQECVSGREFHQSKIVQGSIGLGDFVLAVGEQLEVQALLSAELSVGIDAVEADSENGGMALRVLRLIHLELVGFAGSTRGLIFRIKIEDDPLAAVVRESDRALLRGQGEIRCQVPYRRLRRAHQQARNQQRSNRDDY